MSVNDAKWFVETNGYGGITTADTAPTIDPVKHGRWEWQDSPVFGNPYGSYMCPLCQNTMPHKTNYCPNCGAKAEEKK